MHACVYGGERVAFHYLISQTVAASLFLRAKQPTGVNVATVAGSTSSNLDIALLSPRYIRSES